MQLAQLREELTELKQAQDLSGRRLAAVEEEAAGLFQELFQARERAQASESRESELAELAARQRDQLRQTQKYTRQPEAELTEQTEQAAMLLREVSVLRAQNTKLLDSTTPAVSFMDTSVDAILAQGAARLKETAVTGAPAAPTRSLVPSLPPEPPRPLPRPPARRTAPPNNPRQHLLPLLLRTPRPGSSAGTS
ncbi:hypothetical protein [Streptomyces sp. NPDC057287]|uniref:hypothetical protein n=1 Tax=Streptomyces sp. NPDC057287 TaxID=3346086 RepID=UPI003644D461